MSVRGLKNLRRETVTAQGRSFDILYYYDPNNNLWLSTTELCMAWSAASSAISVHLNTHGGVQSGLGYGPYSPFPFVVTWVTLKSTNTVTPNADCEIYSGTTLIHTESWSTTEKLVTPFALSDSAVNGNSVSVRHKTNGGGAMQNMIVTLGLKWRLP